MWTLLVFLAILRDTWGGLEYSKCPIARAGCPNENVTFWLYNRAIQDDPYQLFNNKESIQRAPFITSAPTIVLIHGYTGNRDFDPNPQIRPAYLHHGEYNVISIDYGDLVPEPCYPIAVRNVPVVGQCSAELLDGLIKNKKVPLSAIHVVGFSLGAQVAGEIGKRITSGKLERITGLDPAMPLFVTTNADKKLDKSDAKFVDIIHTDALDKGKLEALGHADFYVNGGMRQPGCENVDKSAEGSCNHVRAPMYYGESINSTSGFYGRKCDSWFLYMMNRCRFDDGTEEVTMGANTPRTAKGLYFVETNSEPPFARGDHESQQAHGRSFNDGSEAQAMVDIEQQNDKPF